MYLIPGTYIHTCCSSAGRACPARHNGLGDADFPSIRFRRNGKHPRPSIALAITQPCSRWRLITARRPRRVETGGGMSPRTRVPLFIERDFFIPVPGPSHERRRALHTYTYLHMFEIRDKRPAPGAQYHLILFFTATGRTRLRKVGVSNVEKP